MADFLLTSSAFAAGGAIPRRHSCDGEDRSPPLSWTAPPTGSRSLALILDDPDAPGGRFVHWLAWGIPPDTGGLAEGEAAPLEGSNDFGSVGYRGPCPPRGRHRYRFRLHALGEELRLGPGAGVRELERALMGNLLAGRGARRHLRTLTGAGGRDGGGAAEREPDRAAGPGRNAACGQPGHGRRPRGRPVAPRPGADGALGYCGRSQEMYGPDCPDLISKLISIGGQPVLSTRTGEAACGVKVDGLEVLDQDWEEAFFVEKCPGCFAAVLADASD